MKLLSVSILVREDNCLQQHSLIACDLKMAKLLPVVLEDYYQ